MHTNSAKFQQKSFSFAFFLLSAIFFRLSAEIEQFCQNFILANSHCRVLPSVQERITKKKRENNAYDFMYSANFNKILLLWSYFAVSNFFGGFHHAFFRRSADKQTFGQTTVQLRTVVRTQGLIPRLSKLDPQSRLSAPKFLHICQYFDISERKYRGIIFSILNI